MAIISTTVVVNEMVANQRRAVWKCVTDSGETRTYGPAHGPADWNPEDDLARVAGIVQAELENAELERLLG